MTKVLALALVLLISVGCLSSYTIAWFTDEETSENNVITSGNLDVGMKWADGKADPGSQDTVWKDASNGAIFNYNRWEPGYVEVRHVKIANEGSLALKYDLKIVPTGEVSKLADVIDVYYIENAMKLTSRSELTDAMKIGTLAQFIAQNDTSANTAAGVLPAGENHTVTIALMMQTSAGNDYQNLSIGSEFKLVLNATQATVEPDSFGNDYDAGAQNPHKVWHVKDFEELKSAFDYGGTIVMTEDIILDEKIVLQTGVSVDLDMNGKKLTAINDKVDPFIDMETGSKLVIKGDGTVDLEKYYATNFILPRGDLTIENGSFIRNYDPQKQTKEVGPMFPGMTNGKGTFIINGGYFDSGYYKENDCYGNCILNLNKSGGQKVLIYGGTFVAQNPAWADEGKGALCPHCDKDGTGCQGVFLDGQTVTDTELPAGYVIKEGKTADDTNRPTYTVMYTKPQQSLI